MCVSELSQGDIKGACVGSRFHLATVIAVKSSFLSLLGGAVVNRHDYTVVWNWRGNLSDTDL